MATQPAFPCSQGVTGRIPVSAKLEATPGAKLIVKILYTLDRHVAQSRLNDGRLSTPYRSSR
jgi:hypothetical protein